MESGKMVLRNYRKQWRNRHREQIYGHGWGQEEGEGRMNGESCLETHTLQYVKKKKVNQ